jgi:RNA polymerase sigma-70 factor (ECF subfamily)
MVMHTTPISLLERMRQPADGEAWGRFVDLYTPVLYAWARRLGISGPDAADLLQEVFVLLIQKLPEFVYDGRKSFRAWLRTVTLNKWRALNRRAVLPTLAGDAAFDGVAAPEERPELDEVEYRRHLVSRALKLMQVEFQPATWKACWECVVEGRPVGDVARELGISVNAVYLAKSRVLRRLHQELDGLID